MTKAGFTLVELSLVLVIIGLIIGGILVGKDLIASAEVRSSISQINGFNAAATTFRSRFGGIPGDIKNATSFIDVTQWTLLANGNGNRLLQDADGSSSFSSLATSDEMTGEIAQFWYQLSAMGLLSGSYFGTAVAGLGFPTSKMEGCGIGVADMSGLNGDGFYPTPLSGNYYQVGLQDSLAFITSAPCFSQNQAYSMDAKMDDGAPKTGQVRASGDYDGSGGFNVPGFGRKPRMLDASITNIDQACTATDSSGKAIYATAGKGVTCEIIVRAPF